VVVVQQRQESAHRSLFLVGAKEKGKNSEKKSNQESSVTARATWVLSFLPSLLGASKST
jgi:hypothetical protein